MSDAPLVLLNVLRKNSSAPAAPAKDFDGDVDPAVKAAFEEALAGFSEASEGTRNDELYSTAFTWSGIHKAGGIGPEYEDAIRDTALAIGLTESETDNTMASAKRASKPRLAPVDTAAAFARPAAPIDEYNALADDIRTRAGAEKATPGLVDRVVNFKGSSSQVSMLKALLERALKDVGLWNTDLKAQLYGKAERPRSFVADPSRTDLLAVAGHQSFDAFTVPAGQALPGDDVNDAMFLLPVVFQSRLRAYAGKFYWWTGRQWEPLNDGAVKRAIGLAIRCDLKKATSSKVRSIFEEMRHHAVPLEIDPPAPHVYFRDGVLHLEDGSFTPHDPNNGNTRTLAVDYDPAAVAPQWLTWLGEVFQSEPARIALLQEVLGWMLVRDTLGIEKAVLLIGPTRAGKGVIARILRALLESGATSFQLNELDDPKRLAAMRSANVAIDPDAVSASPRNARAVMGLFKAITSNDPLGVPLLYAQAPWQGQLHCKLMVLANSAPSMFDDSAATANRWLPIVFDRSYLGREDPDLFKRLTGELPGVAAWAVQGLLRLVKRGRFELPQSSLDQLDSMVSEGGSVQDFIGECLLVAPGYRCSDADLWAAYRGWAINSGHELGVRRRVLKSIEDALRGHGVRRVPALQIDGRFYRGFYGVQNRTTEPHNNVLAFRPTES